MSWHAALVVLLWYNVLSLAVWFGGTIYQILVIVPLWSHAPPQSVRAFFRTSGWLGTINRFFGRRTMALRALPLVLQLVVGWPEPALRPWLAAPVVAMAAGLAMTLAYIYPMNELLMLRAGGDLGDDEVRALVRRWNLADRVRLAIMTAGYLCLLRAFQLAA